MKPKKKKWKILTLIVLCVYMVGIITLFWINAYVKHSVKDNILTIQEATELKDVDCILVLGCLVKSDGTPSDMLSDRLTRGIELYNEGVSSKILMSGDHGREDYDEVGAMKRYAVNAGIDSGDVFMDHKGFSTYDSIYRAKEVFGAKRIVIVTQKYHLYRALYIAEELGIEAYGVASDYYTYSGQTARDFREVLARNKDFVICMFKPEPKYLGKPISLDGDGNVTNEPEYKKDVAEATSFL